ncbi:hypothetical protein SAMN02910355_1058 [Terrisporobacter glycolicus]|nr:hypothetical protein SAMN02910355_1058 [Terrisporobacter glycolicus]
MGAWDLRYTLSFKIIYETKKTKPIYRIYRIILTIPVYIAIIYRSYNFRINVESIIFTFIYLSMICIDLYLYNKKIKDQSKFK